LVMLGFWCFQHLYVLTSAVLQRLPREH
jgi:hypothetical protein